MIDSLCTRAWQAEAVEDGRLEGAERASYERHTSTCGSCSQELRELRQLRQRFQQLTEVSWTPLERRRQRLALLTQANRLTTKSAPRWRVLSAAALVPVMAGLLVLVLRNRGPSPAERPRLGAPSFEVTAERDATWRTEQGGVHTKVRLVRGALALHVEKLDADQRFILSLPDGQLEVRGTRFTVEVKGEHTHRVSVSEGVVALALHGAKELVLNSGEHWSAPLPAPGRTKEATGWVPTTQAESHDGETAPSDASHIAGAAGASANAPTPHQRQAGAVPERGKAFASAMDAFEKGAYAEAEQRFRGFLRAYPADARAEDATFLCAVARTRLGDAAGAARWARRYLSVYPRGLRHGEAEKMAGLDSPPREQHKKPHLEL